MDDKVIEFWAQQYLKRGLQKYINFELYLKMPHEVNRVFDELDHRPLMPAQQAAAKKITEA